MTHGGKRPGAGRKRGQVSEETSRRKEIADVALNSGLTPLEFMLNVLRDTKADFKDRYNAAVDAAPYIHPKLAAVDVTADVTVTAEEEILKELQGKSRGIPNGDGTSANH